MSDPITDHSYRPDRAGQWVTGRCDKCGEPRVAHAGETQPYDPRAICGDCGHVRSDHGRNRDAQTGYAAPCYRDDCECSDHVE